MRKAAASLRGDLASVVVFCFPALRFDMFSPYRDSRYCGAPERGKEKQKSYDYSSAIFDPSSLCSPPYCVRFGARLRGKFRSKLPNPPSPTLRRGRPRITRMSQIGERSARRLDFGWRPTQTPYNWHRICNSAGRVLPDLSDDPISVLFVLASP